MKTFDQMELEGGQAFACGNHDQGGHPGMTLRDWFAGQFLSTPGLLHISLNPEQMAELAYKYADALIEKRNEGI